MQLPRGAVVAVADGRSLHLYRNAGDELRPELEALPAPQLGVARVGSPAPHLNGASTSSDRSGEESGFAFDVADFLNRQVLDGAIAELVIVAPPRTLGELRRHYHKQLSARLMAEIGKELAGHGVADIQTAISSA